MYSYYPAIDFLPHDLFIQMRRNDMLVLKTLFGIFRIKRKDRALKSCTIWPGEQWLADKTKLSISAVSRAVCNLERLMIVMKKQSRTPDQEWGHNWYWLPEWLTDLWKKGKDGEKPNDIPRLHLEDNNSINDVSREENLTFLKRLKAALASGKVRELEDQLKNGL